MKKTAALVRVQSGTLSPGQIIKCREFNTGKYFQSSYRSEKTNGGRRQPRGEQNRKWGPFPGLEEMRELVGLQSHLVGTRTTVPVGGMVSGGGWEAEAVAVW